MRDAARSGNGANPASSSGTHGSSVQQDTNGSDTIVAGVENKGVRQMVGQAAVLEAREIGAVVEQFEHTSSRELERIENGIAGRVLPISADTDVAPVRLQYRGRTVIALPLDNRRFIRAMARFLSMN